MGVKRNDRAQNDTQSQWGMPSVMRSCVRQGVCVCVLGALLLSSFWKELDFSGNVGELGIKATVNISGRYEDLP